MTRALDITGQVFGRLTAICPVAVPANPTRWRFMCECGMRVVIRLNDVRMGRQLSCGCRRRELAGGLHRLQDGQAVLERYTHRSYSGMIRRCEDKTHKSFKHYGAKGVSVYFDWLGPGGFVQFLKDVGVRPWGMTLDRFPDPAGNYEPGNVRWATAREQNLNKRRR